MWVYDLESRKRVQRIKLRSPSLTFMGYPVPLGSDWLNSFLLDHIFPSLGIDQIAVTQDDEPLLLTGAVYTGGLCVYDARSGEILRRLFTGNMTTQGLYAQPSRDAVGQP